MNTREGHSVHRNGAESEVVESPSLLIVNRFFTYLASKAERVELR
jgi:hypothetical protein